MHRFKLYTSLSGNSNHLQIVEIDEYAWMMLRFHFDLIDFENQKWIAHLNPNNFVGFDLVLDTTIYEISEDCIRKLFGPFQI